MKKKHVLTSPLGHGCSEGPSPSPGPKPLCHHGPCALSRTLHKFFMESEIIFSFSFSGPSTWRKCLALSHRVASVFGHTTVYVSTHLLVGVSSWGRLQTASSCTAVWTCVFVTRPAERLHHAAGVCLKWLKKGPNKHLFTCFCEIRTSLLVSGVLSLKPSVKLIREASGARGFVAGRFSATNLISLMDLTHANNFILRALW